MLASFSLAGLENILPVERLRQDHDICVAYAHDYSLQKTLPRAVVFPLNADEISAIVRYCGEQRIPITARGGGTGTSGAAVPLNNGIVMAFSLMNRILTIDPINRLAIVEAGVSNEACQRAVQNNGFFWAPDPGSMADCTIGGNIACNAAGPRALKYGATRDNVLGLTAVTGVGEQITCGGWTNKSSTAYDLTRLLIGSEGTLALVTQAVLKLIPLPAASFTERWYFQSVESAAAAISELMQKTPSIPAKLELLDLTALQFINVQMDQALPTNTQAILLCSFDGHTKELTMVGHFLKSFTPSLTGFIKADTGFTPAETQQLWQIRKSISPQLRERYPLKISEDIVVPISHLVTFIQQSKQISQQFTIPIVHYGHGGNGNLHVNLLIDHTNQQNTTACLSALFELVIALHGMISGEHGIGLLKRPYISQQFDEHTLNLMRQIKKQFDPYNILNPDKIFPLSSSDGK